VSVLHMVVTCTDRKTVPLNGGPRACQLPPGTLEMRMDAWRNALTLTSQGAVPAEELYAGDHWSVVRSLRSVAPAGLDLQVWVASAGYGLLPSDALIRPYSATFARGAVDAVAPKRNGYSNSDWWGRLAEWHPIDAASPRTISELAASAQNDFVLIAVSSVYAHALSYDLSAAIRENPSDRLAVVSAGHRCAEELQSFQVPAAARLKTTLGGAMQSLNARIARDAVSQANAWYPSRARLARLMQSALEEAPPMTTHDRKRLDDEEIRRHIRESLRGDPRITHSRLLRSLRDKGLACEQSRFASLFREVRGDRSVADAVEGKE
jgi:hypothetical protein